MAVTAMVVILIGAVALATALQWLKIIWEVLMVVLSTSELDVAYTILALLAITAMAVAL